MKFRIKEMAMQKGFTQKTLAKKMGVTEHTTRWYYVTDSMNTKVLERIAEALECEIWQLITTESKVLATGEGEVKCPKAGRVPLSQLEFCYDSK